MSFRTSEDAVKAILDTNLGDCDLKPFITAANLLVDALLEDKTILSKPLKTEIERWLAAHFAAIRDKRVSEDEVGPARFTYEGKTAMRLDFTRYGQQAIVLDITGTLGEIGSGTETAAQVAFLASFNSEATV